MKKKKQFKFYQIRCLLLLKNMKNSEFSCNLTANTTFIQESNLFLFH